MMIVGRVAAKVDPRALILTGLLLTSLSLWQMTFYTTDTSSFEIITVGITQGLGLGFMFVPLSSISFATLSPHFRNEGTALFSLMRNIGSSIGISIVMTYLSRYSQMNHAALAQFINPYNLTLSSQVATGGLDVSSPQGLMQINALVNNQANLLAYLQDFRLMMWITLFSIPLLLLFRKSEH